MSKAVLIIDMPSCCRECMCYVLGASANFCGQTRYVIFNNNIREAHCPLKPLPEEDNTEEYFSEWSRGYQGGWNDCINAIVGGKNDDI